MSGVSSIFNEVIINNTFKNEFLSFWNSAESTLHNDFMPAEMVENSADIATLKPKVSTLETGMEALSTASADITTAKAIS